MSEIYPEEIKGTHRELGSVNQFFGQIHQFRLLAFICFQCLRRNRLIVYDLNAFTHPKQIFYPQRSVFIHEIQKTNIRSFRS